MVRQARSVQLVNAGILDLVETLALRDHLASVVQLVTLGRLEASGHRVFRVLQVSQDPREQQALVEVVVGLVSLALPSPLTMQL